ncbi:MAG: caspase family protein, partial [Candidatus Lokiarchaeota archaeon]
MSDYPGTSYDLSYCDDDAIGVYNMLINDYNFKPENIIYLQDSSATKNEINNAINTIKSLISEDDIFLFYYSGHGGHGIYSTQGSWNVESLHPYWDNYDQIWSVSHPGALYMRVHFERFQTEDFYDYALCGGWDVTRGYYYEKLSGNLGYNFWSSYIPVSRYYLRFFSDDSITNYGFKIDKYEAIMEDGTHYLCSFDSIPNNPSAYYTDTLLDQKLDSIICSDKYIILDSCNSGGIIPEVQDIGRYIMTACRGTEESLETPSLEHGIFTNFLLESKENANDENSDGVISIEECYSYVHSKTRSYSGSFGSEYRYSPQESDGINGEAVLYPAIGGVTLNRIGNQLSYSFTLYGHGKIKVLNMTVCSVYPDYQFKTINLKNIIFSPTGFGYYNGIVEFAPGYIPYGVQFYAEIEGSQTLIINFTYGDYDGDGLDDIFEISQGIGLDPCLNDTDSDGLNDYDEFYGNTNPVDNDSDNDGLLDGDEINLYGTDPINSDSDNDGLLDGDEINLYGTDPINSDSDNDGLLDGEEVNLYGSDPMDNDSDIDGLSDGDEINIYLTNPIINDTDSDNLSDGEEVNLYGTNPIEADSDFDKINDFDEIFVYNTDPLKEDSDGDNLNDMDEIVTYGTDPLNNDTDFDLITDGYEVLYGLNPLEDDSNLDPDSDLLNNLEEFIHLTDPHLNDTDSDYLLDGEEIKSYGTSPINEDSDFDNLSDGLEVLIYETDPLMIDTDSDGLSDGDEVLIHGTNPLSEDSDSDAMPDEWEVLNLTDPLINDTKCDPDSDGLLNIQEYNLSCNPQDPDTDDDGWLDGDEVNTYGTDPLDPNSHPNPSTSTIPGYNFSIIFSLSLITFIV